jgi:glutamine synthetase
MPKPLFGVNGSGMHTNQSLFKDGKNAFYDPSTPTQLSEDAMYYIGGLLKYIREFTAITNPIVNSYKRIVPGYEAPVYITWSAKNRSSLIRIPAPRGKGTRVELRCPDPSCNPYLAFALMLRAGLDGTKNKIEPGEPTNVNIFHLSEKERKERGIRSLPENLKEAIDEMRNSEFVREVLGEHVFSHYLSAKKLEWDEYKTIVHPWELSKYFQKL